MRPDDEDEESRERFAELVGPTKRLDKGPARVSPRPARTRETTRPGDSRDASRAVSAPRFRWPNAQERRLAATSGVSDMRLHSLERGEIAPEERIDLHRLRSDAAEPVLARRIDAARQRGLRCVLVIHGRGARSPGGDSVLRDALPDWLTGARCARHVLAFAPAPPRLGGEGATLVLLRRTER